MKTRWMLVTAAALALVAAAADAQTTATTAQTARPAAAAAPAARAVGVDQTAPAPPAPPAAPAPPAPPAAVGPQAPPSPQAPPVPRSPRAPVAARSTGEAPAPPEEVRHPRGQPVNLRLEFTVTDQIGSAPPVKKTITMNVADGESGRIRTNADVYRKNSPVTVVPLSVDAYPTIEGGKIRLRASLEYQLLSPPPEPELPAGKTSIAQGVTSILSDGVSTVLSQSADPLTDRKVTLEVKATIIR
jgi:glucose/arabinose dehydrogenase